MTQGQSTTNESIKSEGEDDPKLFVSADNQYRDDP